MLLDCDSGPEIWHRPPNVTMGRMLSFPHNWISARRLQCRLWPSYWPRPCRSRALFSIRDHWQCPRGSSHLASSAPGHMVTAPGSSIIDNVYKTIADTEVPPFQTLQTPGRWLVDHVTILASHWSALGSRQMMAPKYVSTLTIKSIIYHEN